IDAAEDRNQWADVCDRLGIPQPAGGTATSIEEALEVAADVGYPALVRPSYVLGGRAMELVYSDEDLASAMKALGETGTLGREGGLSAERPVLIDRFLESAIEVDVDAVRDIEGTTIIGGVMEHVEEAGVHSGDSACVLPPPTLSPKTVALLSEYTTRIADELGVVGLINVQYAVKDGEAFVIEANPRASRTVPFVAKATGRPLAKVASRVMTHSTLAKLIEEGLLPAEPVRGTWSVKEAVLPFNRFPETDALLGPEMRSTGEVMGIDVTPGLAFVKSQLGAGTRIPEDGAGIFMSLADRDKDAGREVAFLLSELGYRLVATAGTAEHLQAGGLEVDRIVERLDQGGTNAVDLIETGEISMVINTPRGRGPRADGAYIRIAAGQNGVALLTTVAAARATARGLRDMNRQQLQVRSLQAVHRDRGGSSQSGSDEV
ncbi:MAG: ATP-grasp domain-containing protein, partial [Acidimicrobiales bacterium]